MIRSFSKNQEKNDFFFIFFFTILLLEFTMPEKTLLALI
jgi:hypothetical protein